MPHFEKFAPEGIGTGLLPVTGLMLARAFVAAWLTAIAAVIILPAILVFGMAMGLIRRVAPRKGGRTVIVEGEYRVLGSEIGHVRQTCVGR